MSAPPTPTQLNVLTFIHHQREGRGVPPTIREIGEWFGWSSTNGTADFIRALETKGLLVHERGRARTMRLTAAGLRWVTGLERRAS